MTIKTYRVGGSVRDELIGNVPKGDNDWVVTGASLEYFDGFKQVGKDFPVFLHPETGEEYALARIERKTGRGYTGFNCDFSPDITIEEDLSRRDLTINAIASDGKTYTDPFNGMYDISNKILRHVGPAFSEDPLRVLRTARFAAKFPDFTIAPETLQLMEHLSTSGELNSLTPERVWMETSKALLTENPHIYFEILKDCHALQYVFPELYKLIGVPQPVKWHPEGDVWTHTMLVLRNAGKLSDPIIKWAALLHDLGKGETPKDILPHHYGHEETGEKIAEELCDRLRVPTEYKKAAMKGARFHTHVYRLSELKPKTILKLLKRIDCFRNPINLERLLYVCECDKKGRGNNKPIEFIEPGILLTMFTMAKNIDVKTIIEEEGLHGLALGQRIHKIRLNKIRNVKKEWLEQTN